MPAYKRSNPKKLQQEQEEILREMRKTAKPPVPQRKPPSLPERLRRGAVGAVKAVQEKVEQAQERKRAKKNPPPREKGAKVIGRRKPSTFA